MCPGLARWLPQQLTQKVGVLVAPVGAGFRLGGELRDLLQAWPRIESVPSGQAPEASATYDAVVVLAPLDESILIQALSVLRVGGRLVELAWPRRDLRWWSRPWSWRSQAVRWSATRIPAWSRAGLVHLEQYVCLDPPDVLITMGRHG